MTDDLDLPDEEDLAGAQEDIEEFDEEPDEEDSSEGERDGSEGAPSSQKGDHDETGSQKQDRNVGRRERAVLAAKEEARKAKEEAAEARQRLEEFTRQQSQRVVSFDPELERQRLELMSPEERLQYRFEQAEKRNDERLQQMQFQMYENSDRAAFKALTTTSKLAEKMAPKVEQELSTLRSKGQNVARETLFTYLVGKEVLERGKTAGDKGRKKASENVRKHATRPSNSQSNVQTPRRNGKTPAEKLDGVFI